MLLPWFSTLVFILILHLTYNFKERNDIENIRVTFCSVSPLKSEFDKIAAIYKVSHQLKRKLKFINYRAYNLAVNGL